MGGESSADSGNRLRELHLRTLRRRACRERFAVYRLGELSESQGAGRQRDVGAVADGRSGY